MKTKSRMSIIYKIGFILAAASIYGCAKKPKQVSVNPLNTEADRALLHTESHEEERVIAEAAGMARARRALTTEKAERCWKVEIRRPRVREACVLAWSIGSEHSVLLDEALRTEAPKSRAFAIAAIRRRDPLRKMNFDEILALLSRIGDDPAWLRALAILTWMSNSERARPGAGEAQILWDAVKLPFPAPDPASIRTAYLLAKQLSLAREEELIRAHCIPAAIGIAQIRCWRFLSALVNPASGAGPDQKAFPNRPSHRESGWTLFERSFPERAVVLQRYWN